MRVLRAVILAIGFMAFAACGGGDKKGAQEPAPAEENPCAAPAEGGEGSRRGRGQSVRSEGGGEEAAPK
jgi:hypothetical protein